MHLTSFSKENKSGNIWPWTLTLTAKTDSRVHVSALLHTVYLSLNFWKTDVSFIGHFLMLSISRSSTSGMRHDNAMVKNTAHKSSARIVKLQYQADASIDCFLLLFFGCVPDNQANYAHLCDITKGRYRLVPVFTPVFTCVPALKDVFHATVLAKLNTAPQRCLVTALQRIEEGWMHSYTVCLKKHPRHF